MDTKLFNYLEGDMNEDERKEFQKEIENNPDLKETIELYKGIDTYLVKKKQHQDAKDFAGEIRATVEQSENKIQFIKCGSIAATLLIIIGLTLFYKFILTDSNYLYKQHFTAWHTDNLVREKGEPTVLDPWIKLYENKEYQSFIDFHHGASYKYIETPQEALMLSSAYMELEQFENALELLNNFDNSNYSFFRADFEWYKGLCYLKLNNEKEALVAFTRIKEQKAYRKKVAPMLRRIK